MYPADEDFIFNILDSSGSKATKVSPESMPAYKEPVSDSTGRLLDMAKNQTGKSDGGEGGIGKELISALFIF